MKGAFNVQTHPLDFEAILVSNFAHRFEPTCQDQALGGLGAKHHQQDQVTRLAR
jgi:hypothetical protein